MLYREALWICAQSISYHFSCWRSVKKVGSGEVMTKRRDSKNFIDSKSRSDSKKESTGTTARTAKAITPNTTTNNAKKTPSTAQTLLPYIVASPHISKAAEIT